MLLPALEEHNAVADHVQVSVRCELTRGEHARLEGARELSHEPTWRLAQKVDTLEPPLMDKPHYLAL